MAGPGAVRRLCATRCGHAPALAAVVCALAGLVAVPPPPSRAARRQAAAAAQSPSAGALHIRPAMRLPLGHAGRWITDAHGRVVILHGVNMVYKVPPYYPAAIGFGADDAAFLHRIGFDAVRVGVLWEAVEPRPGVYDGTYLRHIAATVRTLGRHGIVSLLDFHQDMYNELFQGEGEPGWSIEDGGLPPEPREGFPDNYVVMPALQRAYDHFWSNSPGPGGVGLQNRYARAWRHVARRFRSDRSVLGYELFNEPFPGSDWETCINPAGCPTFDPLLTAFNRRVATAIRAVDRHSLIWYEPNIFFDFGAGTEVGPLHAGPAGFAFHDYCEQESIGPASGSCHTTYTRAISNALEHVRKTNEALLMTEFGDPNYALMREVVRLDDRNMVPWLEWSYCPCNDPTGAATKDRLVSTPRKPPRGSNVNHRALEALVEPYPQVVAGTPLHWGFNRRTKTFSLRYATSRASRKGRFPARSLTEIAVPPFVFKHGYAVTAQGGAIDSGPAAGVLEIASCPGARMIRVTVTARGRDRESCAAR